MCFTVTDPKIKIAEEDIECYKRLAYIDEGAYSWWEGHLYREGKKQPRVKLDPSLNIIAEGYHSYINQSWPSNAVFIILRGTKYYQNGTERVSETIIFKGWL